ncbi:MAG: glycine--tRNA ligase subunit beta [Smithellaceae bacterium]|nr:glycine--tRNA ligase subunit beta [Smithellaceae bacterium]
MNKELFLEIGTEEIPAGFLPFAMRDMADIMRRELLEQRLSHGEIRTFSTPRRLAMLVENIADMTREQRLEKLGPATRAAWDQTGKPTAAALGFARSQGVDIAALETAKTEKGEYLCVRKTIPGEETASLLPDILSRLVSSIPFRKSMRWGISDFRFARPIHWILALYDGAVVPFQAGNIASGDISRGHRFLSPAEFTVRGFDDYLIKTRERHVLIDPEERRQIIREEALKAALGVGGVVHLDPDLLSTVSFLLEHPTVVIGGFDQEFLALPKELLMTVMMSHQKYFPVTDKEGKLLPYFITVSNTPARDLEVVRRGNEKVIRARLADARFFFEEDKKIPLQAQMEGLRQVIFHTLLGTSYDKVTRFSKLALRLAEFLAPDVSPIVERAAWLAKADLLTKMVGEFPELQGVMGREYALAEGEDPRIAVAIYEHYLPNVSGGDLPRTNAGAIVSIADKIDSIVGFFGVNLPPTGAADPYALRRQALGIINILMERGYKCELAWMIDLALANLSNYLKKPVPQVKQEVLDFFQSRFTNLLISQGHPYDVVEAVASGRGISNILEAWEKVTALETFRSHGDFAELAAAFKRVENIIRGQQDGPSARAELLVDEEEKRLYEVFCATRVAVLALLETGDYLGCLSKLAGLRKPIDDFFTSVMVMAKEEDLRRNRISLLQEISRLIRKLADFSKIQDSEG